MSRQAAWASQAELAASADRGVAWVEARTNPDGSFVNAELELAAYYKSLLAFAVCGRVSIAARSLEYLKRHLAALDGSLASEQGTSKTSIVRMGRNLANYMDGWVAIGAWLLGDYAFAERVCTRLCGEQGAHGGILTGPERWSGTARYDLATTASCGRAFLIAGHRHEALSAANFLATALAHQRDASTGLDLSFDGRWQPLDPPAPDERTYFRYDVTKRGEKVWFPAFSSAFLCEMHAITGESRFLEAARRYFDLIERSPESLDGTIANGKSGWAAGLLAAATGDPRYVAAQRAIAVNVLARQRADGEFGENPAYRAAPGGGGSTPRRDPAARDARVDALASTGPAELGRRLERTAEFTAWVVEFLRAESRRSVPIP